jgi:predicted nuclease of predicted toxin-antitoxin system
MSLRLLLDMNLSPDWVEALRSHGIESRHWSKVGDPRAADAEIMAWAASNGFVVFTHDLDFGTALAVTRATGPSVFQIRGSGVLPEGSADHVVATLRKYDRELANGALVVFEENRARVRILPF